MPPRATSWKMSAGETLRFAKSLRGDIATGDSLVGQTPNVTVWRDGATGYVDVTTSAGFTVANKVVNTAPLTTESGETIAIGDGVQFRLTASQTPGSYLVRVECPTVGGDRAVSDVPLIVAGTKTPAA